MQKSCREEISKGSICQGLMTNPKVFLCDEPTQAVDVKTRSEIHKLLRERADSGSAVVYVSSDLKRDTGGGG